MANEIEVKENVEVETNCLAYAIRNTSAELTVSSMSDEEVVEAFTFYYSFCNSNNGNVGDAVIIKG